ncbi:MAG: HAMP domain-containing protein [Holophagaceae bacterium]|nr:HAMP domain-containing protein [Holophagaceae bacterium]
MLRISIKTKLGFILGLLVLSFFAFNVVYYPRRVESQIRHQAELSARQVAETASYALTPALTAGNREGIANVLVGVKHIPAFSFSVVYDSAGNRVDSTEGTPAWTDEYAKSKSDSKVLTRTQDGVVVAMTPVIYSDTPKKSGTLVLGFSTDESRRTVDENFRLSLIVGLSTMGFGIVLTAFMSRRYLKPIIQLTNAAQMVAQGNFDDVAVDAHSRDELEELSRNFQIMTNKLRVSRDEIERQNRLLEYRVQERTRQLMETIWELEEIRANLEQLVQERTKGLEQSRGELKAWADTLESKVEDKTRELREANLSLMDSYKKRQQADRMKDEFLANMSHELRTPLNAIIGFSGMLMQEETNRVAPDVREDLQIIFQNGTQLLGHIDSILDLSKIEAGKMELDLQEVDPLPLVDEVLALAAGLIRKKPITLSFDRPEWSAKVLGDAARLKQVMTNLVGNAIKFTEEGEVTLFAARTGGNLEIGIRDTGIGMSESEMERLFKPFQQVDGSITRRFGGTGLGLAISQKFMGLMNGQIRARSAKGKGSTFIIEMPLLREGAP